MSTRTDKQAASQHPVSVTAPDAYSPLGWLRAGWHDFSAAPLSSMAIGLAFTVLSAAALTAAKQAPASSAAFVALVLLLAPFIAAAAYCIPLLRRDTQSPGLTTCLRKIRQRVLNISLFSLVTVLLLAAWVRITSISFALTYGHLPAGAAELAGVLTASSQSTTLAIFLAVAGFILAATLFAISAISLPMMVERNANVVSAMATSIATVRRHLPAAIVWALIVAASLGIALWSNLLLMPVLFPLLAYATWHSYRELYRPATEPARG